MGVCTRTTLVDVHARPATAGSYEERVDARVQGSAEEGLHPAHDRIEGNQAKSAIGDANILVGFGVMMVGFGMMTRWR